MLANMLRLMSLRRRDEAYRDRCRIVLLIPKTGRHVSRIFWWVAEPANTFPSLVLCTKSIVNGSPVSLLSAMSNCESRDNGLAISPISLTYVREVTSTLPNQDASPSVHAEWVVFNDTGRV